MSNDKAAKNYCYSNGCGPVVRGGFHLEDYKVCKSCKMEITESLAFKIKNDEDKKAKPAVDDESYIWGMPYHDDGDS